MKTTKEQLEFLDAEINRYSTWVTALRNQIKTECDKIPQDGTKKEAYEFVRSSLYQELTGAFRRYEALEECRLGVIMDELAGNTEAEQPKEQTEKVVKTRERKTSSVGE